MTSAETLEEKNEALELALARIAENQVGLLHRLARIDEELGIIGHDLKAVLEEID
jgi:hypothetical protein